MWKFLILSIFLTNGAILVISERMKVCDVGPDPDPDDIKSIQMIFIVGSFSNLGKYKLIQIPTTFTVFVKNHICISGLRWV